MDATISIIIFIVAILAVIIINATTKPGFSKGIIGSAFFLTVIGGLLIYGYCYMTIFENWTLAAIKTFFAIMKIFLGEDSYDDIADMPGFSSEVFQILFWLLHLLGLFATAGAAVTAFGAGLIKQLRLRLSRKGNLSVILGVTEETLAFGRELTHEYNSQIVYVDKNTDGISSEIINDMNCVLFTNTDALQGNVKFLKSLGIRSSQKAIRIYALTADAVTNHQFAENILAALKKFNISPKQTALTILSTENEINISLQAWKNRYGYGNVFVLDEAEMAARLLVKKYPPSNHITFDKTGIATENFHGLIVGFGRVGQAVLHQLVRNAQFEGSHFQIAVFAPNYEQEIGSLWHECRQMITNYDISFWNQDARSLKMYDYLAEHADSLKYITICTGNERLNDEIAEQLRHFLSTQNADVKIYICSKKRIAHLKDINMTECFDIYTHSILCSDEIDRLAMALHHSYCSGNGLSAKENWLNCDYFSRMSSRASADFAPALLRAAGVSKEKVLNGQWLPKGELLENLAKTEHLRWCAFHYSMGFRPMTDEEYEERCQIYLREIAEQGAGRIRLGKDMRRRIHACLIDWEALDNLSEKENAITGGNVNYKQLDRNNVLMLPQLLKMTEIL